jgi:GDP-mannose 6-dehydrogenase
MESQGQSISVFGLGYVGSVTAACLAHFGNCVVGVDTNPKKVETINARRSPIIEAQMDELILKAHQASRLRATTDAVAAICDTDVSFVCVGTPSQRNGKLDLSHIERACYEVGEGLKRKKSPHCVAIRSTILPGTTVSRLIPVMERASGKRAGIDFSVCYNPEFMREGSAVADFLHPPYTILGANDACYFPILRQVYGWVQGQVFETSLAVAEMVKYASNAFHALKVSFANELGTLARLLGVDTVALTEIFTSDTRLNISSAYLSPGFAFGGSCLPKDLRALNYCAKELDLQLPLLEAILPSNQNHVERAVQRVLGTGKKEIALLGLSFKAGTDDLRESPLVQMVKRLLGEGCQIRIWDPQVSMGKLMGANRQFIEETIPHIGNLLSTDLGSVIESAEVVIIGTRAVQKDIVEPMIRPGQIIFDLVNLEKARRAESSSEYEGICW